MKNFNWMKYKLFYFSISIIVIAVGVFSLVKWGLPLGVDFKGGSLVEYKFDKAISTEEIVKKIEDNGVKVTSSQETESKTYIFKFEELTQEKKNEVTAKLGVSLDVTVEELKFEQVGPSIGPDLVKKTIIALLISAFSILLWIAYQFKSIKFGFSAVIAMFHDSLVLIGLFSLLGHLYGAEIDFLFVTALLTILSFSVHDTIVVYDRIREIRKKHGGEIKDIANSALSETMRRSVNNSLTIIFMLVALVVLGGSSVKWFAVALLIGTVSGTYSSPFVAVPILVTWEEVSKKLRNKKNS